MVFENLVADLLNRFLGDYIDNLDASQLNIGIWGGMRQAFGVPQAKQNRNQTST